MINATFMFGFVSGQCPSDYGRAVDLAVFETGELQKITEPLLIRTGDLLAHNFVTPERTLESIVRRLEEGNPWEDHFLCPLISAYVFQRKFIYLWTFQGLDGIDTVESLHEAFLAIPEYIGLDYPDRGRLQQHFYDHALPAHLAYDGGFWVTEDPVRVTDLKENGFEKVKRGDPQRALFKLLSLKKYSQPGLKQVLRGLYAMNEGPPQEARA